MGPLDGIKVLDLSRVLAGPWATQALADFGATVHKIERPGEGDDTRTWGPPWLKDQEGKPTSESAYFLSANRGKKSVAIDISRTEGQELVRALARNADVLVENFKVGTLARYGLGWRDLAPTCPRLVYCSISAFGQSGPDASGPGYDAMIQGRGGLMSLTGLPDGPDGGGPQKVGVAVVDLMTGMYAVSAIVAALYERRASGHGQHIDLALLDTQVAWLANQSMNFLISGDPPRRQGTAHPNIVPYQAFATADGNIMLAVGNDRQFATFCEVAGQGQLALDDRFVSNAARVAHREVLVPMLSSLLKARASGDWIKALTQAGVPCGPINDLAAVFADPQVQYRQMRFDLPHAAGGTVPQVRNPVLFSRSALDYGLAPPLLGEHTVEVLRSELQLSVDQIAALETKGIVSSLKNT